MKKMLSTEIIVGRKKSLNAILVFQNHFHKRETNENYSEITIVNTNF